MLKTTADELDQRRLKLIEDIRTAFDWVILWDGIGPNETMAIEDYIKENSEEYKIAKKKDQEIWERYWQHMLEIAWTFDYILYFWDLKWQIFALPAYMTDRLMNEWWKIHIGNFLPKKDIKNLSLEQQKIATEYLNLLQDAKNYFAKKKSIHGIKNLWERLFNYSFMKRLFFIAMTLIGLIVGYLILLLILWLIKPSNI